jgi:hypothetical protein
LLVVRGLGLTGLLLDLCTRRLRCLLLGLFVRLSLLPSAAHCANRGADRRSFSCISGDSSDGSHDVHRLDLRSSETARHRPEGGTSADAARHRGRKGDLGLVLRLPIETARVSYPLWL